MSAEWGCPKCGHPESWVRDTARDEENVIVRRRQCTRCDAFWATEERPILTKAY